MEFEDVSEKVKWQINAARYDKNCTETLRVSHTQTYRHASSRCGCVERRLASGRPDLHGAGSPHAFPSPANAHTATPSPPVDLPPAWGLALPIILGSLGVMVLIFVPTGLILFWLISSNASTIDKRQGK